MHWCIVIQEAEQDLEKEKIHLQGRMDKLKIKLENARAAAAEVLHTCVVINFVMTLIQFFCMYSINQANLLSFSTQARVYHYAVV